MVATDFIPNQTSVLYVKNFFVFLNKFQTLFERLKQASLKETLAFPPILQIQPMFSEFEEEEEFQESVIDDEAYGLEFSEEEEPRHEDEEEEDSSEDLEKEDLSSIELDDDETEVEPDPPKEDEHLEIDEVYDEFEEDEDEFDDPKSPDRDKSEGLYENLDDIVDKEAVGEDETEYFYGEYEE